MGALLLCYLFLVLASSARAGTWLRPAACKEDCDANHQCVSNICSEAWDSCEEGLVQTRSETITDSADCYDNGCGWGGCDKPGYVQVSSQHCVNLKVGCLGMCQQETCCRLRAKVQCCQRLNCTEDLADCRIAQQKSLLNSSRSEVYYTTIASGGSATFPFYSSINVLYGNSCDAVRVWGSCSCVDGTPTPGCLFNDSSSWQTLDTDTSDSTPQPEPLPPRLSLTCVVLPPLPPPFPPPEPAGPWPSPEDAYGQGTLPTPQPDGNDDDDSHHMSGGTIAGFVLVSVLGVALLAGGGTALIIRIRSTAGGAGGGAGPGSPPSTGPSSYQAVWTGQSYTPGLSSPKIVWPAPIRRAIAYWDKMMTKLRGEVADGAAAARAAYSNHRAKLEAKLAVKYPRNGPAVPVDVEDDELYTLEDLEDPGDPPTMYSYGKTGQGRELELGPLSDGADTVQPLLHQPTPIQYGNVIHTTAVQLGSSPGLPVGHHPGSFPVTPQPTGGGTLATSRHYNHDD